MGQVPSLRQLEYVVAVAEEGHFGRASRRCGVSQPALSKQLQEAEGLLGVALFERGRRGGVVVTRAGAEVVVRAKRALAEVRALTEAAHCAGGDLVGPVALGVIPTVGPYFLPGLMGRLAAAAPRARWSVREQQTEPMLAALRAGDLDLALLALPLPPPLSEDGLDGVTLLTEPFVLVLPPGHPLGAGSPRTGEAAGAGVDAEALGGERLLLMEEGHCFRGQALTVCAGAGAAEVEVRAASLSTLLAMVEAGIGPTLAPLLALDTRTDDALQAAGVRAVRFAEPAPSRQLGLRWRATSPWGARFAALAQAFTAHGASLLARLPPRLVGPSPTA